MWEPLKQKWGGHYDKLVQYEKRHDHCNVSSDVKSKHSILAVWCSQQRRKYQKGTLSTDQIHLLEKIGFMWEPFKQKWEEQYDQLVQYKKRYSHCNVSAEWVQKI